MRNQGGRAGRGQTARKAADPASPASSALPAAGTLPPGADAVALARDAFRRGQLALEAGNAPEAVRWLDRAHRLAPADGTVTLTLASACLRDNHTRAEALFGDIAAVEDLREAWLGLAAARLAAGDAGGAATALADALARHAPDAALLSGDATLADAIARTAGAPGWCGLTGNGRLVIGAVSGLSRAGFQDRPGTRDAGDIPPDVRLDGRPIRCAPQSREGTRIPLPPAWTRAREITVCLGGRPLLGSPIQVAAIRQVAGFVEAHLGELRGWAWHPGDPDTAPDLMVQGATGRRSLRITATDQTIALDHAGPLARPRGFAIPADALIGLTAPIHIRDRDGRDLLGSPLDPWAEQASAAAATAALAAYLSRGSPGTTPISPVSATATRVPPGSARATGRSPGLAGAGRIPPHTARASGISPNTARATGISPGSSRPTRIAPLPPPAIPADIIGLPRKPARPRHPRPVAIVMPVYGGGDTVRACLDSVLATLQPPHRLIVVDDASPEPGLQQHLKQLQSAGRLRLVRHARNQGFPASANTGIAAAAGHDVILLNSDTLLPPGWVERLREACHAAPDIGTATPFSNQASILSYPGTPGSNPIPDLAATIRLDAAARRANKNAVTDIPVGVGFCLYLRRDCLDAVGPLRADIFAQGYGEENDFCLRARHLGWRNVAATGVFVAHLGGASFGAAGHHLRTRNEALLNRLHPGYDRLIEAFGAADPLADARRRFDLARWRADSRRTSGAAILITHDDGGGVEREVRAAAARHRSADLRPIVLRPQRRPDAGPLVVIDGETAGFPNLCYALPAELPALLRLLHATSPRIIEVHHTLHHPPQILDVVARLGVPYDVFIHDYPWFCPQVALVGPTRRYCGEPDASGCEACVADAGSVTGERISVQALRERSAAFLADARRVVAPSDDAALRMRNHFPRLRPIVEPQEDDAGIPDPPGPQPSDGRCRVCLVGAIGMHKGYDILLACARDAAARRLPLDFVVVGHTIDDARLLNTGRVFITGGFRPDEALSLIRAQRASLALLPSVCPETWSRALTELWLAGLSVAAFDIGAPAERIRVTGRGFLLPLGLPARGINHALVAATGLTVHEDP